MNHPGTELQKEIYQILSQSILLENLLGAGKIFDDVPPGTTPPYITFAHSVHKDFGTDTEIGMEHEIEIHAWSLKNGRKQLLEVTELIVEAVCSLHGPMIEHFLCNIGHQKTEIEPKLKQKAYRARLKFRAMTEPA